jgi:hypothetical protein
MLTIRQEQLDVFAQESMRSFIERMVKHLNQFFPEECHRAGGGRVLAAIQQGIGRAAKYGITAEVDVARYIDLSVALGLDFDSGKRFPWAIQILQSNDEPQLKLQKLFEQFKQVRPVTEAMEK